MTPDELSQEREREIQRLQHAMQAGVATEMNISSRSSATQPKHLRVGINTAMVDHGALVLLLVQKGVITASEYQEARLTAWKTEVRRYEELLARELGAKVRLV